MRNIIALLVLTVFILACGPTRPDQSRSAAIPAVSSTAQLSTGTPLLPTPSYTPPAPKATATSLPTSTSTPEPTFTSTPTILPSSTPELIASPTGAERVPLETQSDHETGRAVVMITKIFNDGTGKKEPDEYVEVRNNGGDPLQLKGWTLEDQGGHVFKFPEYLLRPGQVCRVYTNEIHPDTCGFSFQNDETAVWNNGGDCAYLKDPSRKIIAEVCY